MRHRDADELGMVVPKFSRTRKKITTVANQFKIDIRRFGSIDTHHNDTAAAKAV
jgi:hypothetical protein